jgi:hypothetical protein
MIITVEGLTIQILSFTTPSNETMLQYEEGKKFIVKNIQLFSFDTKTVSFDQLQTHLPSVKLIGSLVLPLERAVMVYLPGEMAPDKILLPTFPNKKIRE